MTAQSRLLAGLQQGPRCLGGGRGAAQAAAGWKQAGGSMEHSSRLLQHGSKRWAAEMLPTVTDMFNQCRKVRSLAAGKRETQVKLLHA